MKNVRLALFLADPQRLEDAALAVEETFGLSTVFGNEIHTVYDPYVETDLPRQLSLRAQESGRTIGLIWPWTEADHTMPAGRWFEPMIYADLVVSLVKSRF